ncbi:MULTISPECIES: DUF1616 domain-containing protein [Salinibaculum]|uniref:DUF1616 domain-containing protein n=1 Tax=Salinibaculum TaxID=2732368 RepID=UPI0030D010CA
MGTDPDWRALFPPAVRRLPADLAAVLGYVGLTLLVVFLPVINETPLRVAVGLPFVLFVPGYAFIAALFPEAGATASQTEAESSEDTTPATGAESTVSRRERGIDGIERVALSFGLSIAIVPLIGLILNFTPWGIRLVPIMLSLSAFTVVSAAVAATRRWALPADEQFRVPYRRWLAAARAELFDPADRKDAALNVLLVISVLLATASVGYAVTVPKQGESFTELYLLNETDDGELLADDYPTEYTLGESRSLLVGIGNHEHQPTEYTVVVKLQRVDRQQVGNETRVTVLEQQELDRVQTRVAANETWHQPYEVTPQMSGRELRLLFLLYRGEAPTAPTIENAYRENHLFINVTS